MTADKALDEWNWDFSKSARGLRQCGGTLAASSTKLGEFHWSKLLVSMVSMVSIARGLSHSSAKRRTPWLRWTEKDGGVVLGTGNS